MLQTEPPLTISRPPSTTDDRAACYPTTAYSRDDIFDFEAGPVELVNDGANVELTAHPFKMGRAEENVFTACATCGRVTPYLLRTITPSSNAAIHPALRTLRALGWLRKVVVEAREGHDLSADPGETVSVALYDFVIPDEGDGVIREDAPVTEWPDWDATGSLPTVDFDLLPAGFDDDELQRRFDRRTIRVLAVMQHAFRVTPEYLRLVVGLHRSGIHEALNNLMDAGFVGLPDAIAADDNDNDIPAGERTTVASLYDYVGNLDPDTRDATHVMSTDT